MAKINIFNVKFAKNYKKKEFSKIVMACWKYKDVWYVAQPALLNNNKMNFFSAL